MLAHGREWSYRFQQLVIFSLNPHSSPKVCPYFPKVKIWEQQLTSPLLSRCTQSIHLVSNLVGIWASRGVEADLGFARYLGASMFVLLASAALSLELRRRLHLVRHPAATL